MKTPLSIAAAYFAAWATHDLDAIMADIAPGCDGKIAQIRDYFDFAAVNAQRQKP